MTSVRGGDPVPRAGFNHEALFYSTDAEFLAGTVPYVRDGVDADDAVLAVVPEPHLGLLRDALGAAAAPVTFVDMRTVGLNPARVISLYLDFVDAHGTDHRPVRGVGEAMWPGRSSDEIVECQIHEALLNVAFGEEAVTMLCPFHQGGLGPSIVEQAQRSHPWLNQGGARTESMTYGEIIADAASFGPPLESMPVDVDTETFTVGELRHVRQRVAALAASAGLSGERAADFVLAASELAANSVRHGGGTGTFAAWMAGTTVVCEVRDSGRIEHPLVGRRRPSPDQLGGRGLWLANQLCDLVQIRVGETDSVVRIHQYG
jgi:anti-sigma regulatory factor (Ser/Thr protein kinase)